MRPHLVVVAAPRFDDDLRLGPRAEPFEAQALVAELAVEALARAVLPRLARVDQGGLDAFRRCNQRRVDELLQQRASDELRSVVGAQVVRYTALADQPRQHLDDAARTDRPSMMGWLMGSVQKYPATR